MACEMAESVSGCDVDSEGSVDHDNSAMSTCAADGIVSVTTPTSGGSSPAEPDAFHGGNAVQNSQLTARSLSLLHYPRVMTALQLLDESDDDSVFCGPPSEPEESGLSELKALEILGVTVSRDDLTDGSSRLKCGSPSMETEQTRRGKCSHEKVQSNLVFNGRPLIAPRGTINDEDQKFICVFEIGLDDDEDFCLVKRILGKSGCNMRRIAEECSAKVRLRGIGSGFLEGANAKEASFPLQLNVSCSDYDSYSGAVARVASLLKDLYKHHRRYARSRGLEVPDTKVNVEEVRRDDLGFDLLTEKAQRSPSERARDRIARKQERETVKCFRSEEGKNGKSPTGKLSSTILSPKNADKDDIKQSKVHLTLPGGMPVPTTPTGRRLAAKAGGAEAAAIVSAAARELDREECEKLRKKRAEQQEQQRIEHLLKKEEAAKRAQMVANQKKQKPTQWKPNTSWSRYDAPASSLKQPAESRIGKGKDERSGEVSEPPREFFLPDKALPAALRSRAVQDLKPAGSCAILPKAPPPSPPPLISPPPPPADSTLPLSEIPQNEPNEDAWQVFARKQKSVPPPPPLLPSMFPLPPVPSVPDAACRLPDEAPQDEPQSSHEEWQVVRRKKKVLWIL